MEKVAEFRLRMLEVPPLQDEEDFFNNDQTLVRFLKAREWNVDNAEVLLKSAVEHRRSTKPLHMDCHWCHERSGHHSMRQVGFDESGRPVIYSSFAQASTHKNTVEDSVTHCTYLIENAKRTMALGVSTWVWVIDCSGMTLTACNPKLGYGVTQVMSNFYPERLGLVICLNHNPLFQGVWKAIKVFLHPNTVAKMKLVRSKDKYMKLFEIYFNEELTEWLLEEIRLNKNKPLSKTQFEFWNPPVEQGTHDPRGCPSYVTKYIDTFKLTDYLCTHLPHPNIVDSKSGIVRTISVSSEEKRERDRLLADQSGLVSAADQELTGGIHVSDDEHEDDIAELKITQEFQIPGSVSKVS
ncbi:uncharacterized protein LOC110457500 [Mizuhopecten yessoensis]|uniref:CRAL-TRIO domain-containing protein C23B6.04c n=1 Tax=Mizuhopecten yessoensis TaxID=6573 RepID=A0A210Q8L7_MIZYE|nr:uncharacterized protein LOC110457500 [Mizuhopecten yessoensis]OWF45087.1 CRAL-TRIO domain-containing protein C23B6.04c [Mizuhopecten yessoensis]